MAQAVSQRPEKNGGTRPLLMQCMLQSSFTVRSQMVIDWMHMAGLECHLCCQPCSVLTVLFAGSQSGSSQSVCIAGSGGHSIKL